MIPIRDIDPTVLRGVDLPALLRFCCDGPGCRSERRQHAIGLIQRRAGRSMPYLVALDDPSDPQGQVVELDGPPSA